MNSENENMLSDLGDLTFYGDFSILPFDIATLNPNQYTQLALNTDKSLQLGFIQSQLPNLFGGQIAANAYILKFPKGLPHTLMRLNQGGMGTTLMNVNGKIAGTASLYNLNAVGTVATCFSLMSLITGQYYLENIHRDLSMINQKVDKILDFLYGDKSAELLSEISFVNDAYSNFNTIMQHEHQKIATLINLQSSKKVAMKDIEFYINDLEKTVSTPTKNRQDFDNLVFDAFKIKDSLELSIQLYTLSNILEVYYSENFEHSYIESVKESINEYVGKCDGRILSSFSHLGGRNGEYKPKLGKKPTDTLTEERIASVINSYSAIKDSKKIINVLDSINSPVEYLLTSDGSVRMRCTHNL